MLFPEKFKEAESKIVSRPVSTNAIRAACVSTQQLRCSTDRYWPEGLAPFGKKIKSLIAQRPPKVIILQVPGLCVGPNFRYSWKCFTQIYRAQYGVGVPP